MKGRKFILGLAGAMGLGMAATDASALVQLNNYSLNFEHAAEAGNANALAYLGKVCMTIV